MKHFVKFGQIPIRSRFHKLLLVGETTSGKASLLKCLMEKKSKVSSPSEKEFSSSCIAMQTKPFKFYKKSKNTWTVWNLGLWHQFYPCFFVSDSIFLFVFDILRKTALPQILSWLKQLVKFQKQKSGHTKQSAGATVIFIGTYTNAPEEAGTFLREFFTSITSNPISKDFIFDGFFGINFHRGTGLTFNSRSLDWEMTGKPFEEIAFLLEEIGSEEPTYVSQSWINLNTELDRIKESEISWNKFVAIARRCGVGKTWGELPLFSCSQKGSFMLSNIIVLKFDWFSRIQKSIDAAITDCRDILLSVENHPMWRYCNQVWDSHRIVPLLLKLQAMVVLRENMRFSFSLLPVEPPPENALEIRGFWGEFDNTGKQVIFSGRSIKCEYFPVASFSEVMTMLWNLPCAVPCWFWREGLLLRAKKEPFENYLLISHTDNETIDICMLSTFSEDVKPSWSNNLMIPVLNLLYHCTSFTEIFTETKFCCPHCLLEYSKLFSAHGSAARVAPVCMPPDITNFTYNEVLDAAVGGLKCLQCKKNKPDPVPVELTGIIPELYATPFPVIGDSTIQYFTALVKYLAIPEHPRLLKFFTARVPFPELPCPVTPHHLNDIQGFTWAQFRKNPVLGDLLNMCTTDRTSPHLLERVLPLNLREKILKDVAFGLEHLHKQIPPITHGDICVENVIISSLDDSGPEPWAKIVLNCSNEELPAKGKNTFQGISRAPEFVSGSTLSTQDDIWNFGILVHQLVYPFVSSIELTRSQPNTLPYTQQPTSSNGNNQFPITTHTYGTPEQQPESRGIRDSDVIMVERYQLGKALATGAYALPPFQFMHNQNISGENPAPTPSTTTATASHHHSGVYAPPWAIQIMTCCWSIDPQTRPPISSILNVWAHFDN
ncbi:hypothetical protein Pelo_3650 [Pelomyxa schiedti]|nr:hypothetical protein Pelo_3650 [Pelomyxa schiedti]